MIGARRKHAVVVLAAVLAAAPAARATSNSTFGTRYLATKKTEGSKVSIQVPPLSQAVANGEWIAERAGVGDELFADSVDVSDPIVPNDSFPNLTGGPPTSGSGASNPVGQ